MTGRDIACEIAGEERVVRIGMFRRLSASPGPCGFYPVALCEISGRDTKGQDDTDGTEPQYPEARTHAY